MQAPPDNRFRFFHLMVSSVVLPTTHCACISTSTQQNRQFGWRRAAQGNSNWPLSWDHGAGRQLAVGNATDDRANATDGRASYFAATVPGGTPARARGRAVVSRGRAVAGGRRKRKKESRSDFY